MTWKCTQCDNEPEAPMTQWLRDRNLAYATTPAEEIRQRWHYETGTGEASDWEGVPASWGEFDGWRYRKLCTDCARKAVV